MTTDYLKYDVGRFLASRRKDEILLADFAKIVGDNLMVVEFIISDQDHFIVWGKFSNLSESMLSIIDVRLLETNVEQQAALCNIKLDSLLALRLRSKRYNWNKIEQKFIEE